MTRISDWKPQPGSFVAVANIAKYKAPLRLRSKGHFVIGLWWPHSCWSRYFSVSSISISVSSLLLTIFFLPVWVPTLPVCVPWFYSSVSLQLWMSPPLTTASKGYRRLSLVTLETLRGYLRSVPHNALLTPHYSFYIILILNLLNVIILNNSDMIA